MTPFEILYHDKALIAINKPIGWFVHRSEFDPQEEKIILQYLRDQIGQYLYPVHRLDRPTSGVLLFALTQEAAGNLSEQFRNKRPTKIYHAIVRGYPDQKGSINYSLQRDLGNDQYEMQEAITHYFRHDQIELPLAVKPYSTARYSLLELNPITGRMHQIRRHLNYISHPIIGDTSHGDLRHNRVFETHFKMARLWLHATHLQLEHPLIDKTLTITAPFNNQWQSILSAMRWDEQLVFSHKSYFLNEGIQPTEYTL